MVPRWSNGGPRWPKMVPRWPQDGPRWFKKVPRWSQEGPKMAKGPRWSRVFHIHTRLQHRRDPFASRLKAALKSHWPLVAVCLLLETRGCFLVDGSLLAYGVWAPCSGPILGSTFGGLGVHFWVQSEVPNPTFSGSDFGYFLVPVFMEFRGNFGAQNGLKGTNMASKSSLRELR